MDAPRPDSRFLNDIRQAESEAYIDADQSQGPQYHQHIREAHGKAVVEPDTLGPPGSSLISRAPSTAPPRSVLSRTTATNRDSSISSYSVNYTTSLAPLQTKGAPDNDGLEPLAEEEIDPASFDLVVPAHGEVSQYSLETRSELLFSVDHLMAIFDDPVSLQRFNTFLVHQRPDSVPLLKHYLDALKALRAISYANSLCDGLNSVNGLDFNSSQITKTTNRTLQERADKALEALTQEDLPAYITFTWVRTVNVTIKRRIANTLPLHLRDLSEGLAEVFCLTDPSRPGNPIVMASEEFHRTTQYGMNYVLGRNCRFLQGPRTNPFSVKRIRDKLAAGVEHCETFLNYRRDGTPFMNLLMVAPLYDSRGTVRYHIGAQIDVSGLVKDCTGLEAYATLADERELHPDDGPCPSHEHSPYKSVGRPNTPHAVDGTSNSFRKLVEMFNLSELKTVREHGGEMHRTQQEDSADHETGSNWRKPRLLIRDDASTFRRNSDPIPNLTSITGGGRLVGPYERYLLVRPYPNMRILFASPTLRTPGILQSSLMTRIGGSAQVKEALTQAFEDGHGVTAKIRWITPSKSGQDQHPHPENAGKGRWMHATPLLGGNGQVGVYMVVLVDDEEESMMRRGNREAPVVDNNATISNAAHARSVSRPYDGQTVVSIQPTRQPPRNSYSPSRSRAPSVMTNDVRSPRHRASDDEMSLASFQAAQRRRDELHRPTQQIHQEQQQQYPVQQPQPQHQQQQQHSPRYRRSPAGEPRSARVDYGGAPTVEDFDDFMRDTPPAPTHDSEANKPPTPPPKAYQRSTSSNSFRPGESGAVEAPWVAPEPPARRQRFAKIRTLTAFA
ncbi:hypothetical protein GGR57DRAFT_446878 [Xylariaceae sp. FL1272]|nr:hypothetical protein GGR57DRAFT_446878 [Xylariaceae sp. FL1272]